MTATLQRKISLLALIICTFFSVYGTADQLSTNLCSTHQTIEEFEVEQRVDTLLLLIQKRLAIMHEVARTKWNEHLSIEDKLREYQVLADLKSYASTYGLEDQFVAQFFQAQIDASKEVQRRDFFLWKENGVLKFEKTFNLKDELRFYIDRLNHEMLLALSKISKPYDIKSDFILDRSISRRHSDYIENDIWLIAISPLRK